MSNGVKTYKVVHFKDLRGKQRGFSLLNRTGGGGLQS
jgi:hypothetical protein